MSASKGMPSPIPAGECWTRSGRHAWESGPGLDRCRNCGAKRDTAATNFDAEETA